MSHPGEGFFAFLLGHTSGHDGDEMGPSFFLLGKPAQKTKCFFLGLMPDGTGVAQHKIGLTHVIGFVISVGSENTDQFLRIVYIHLTTNGIDICLSSIVLQNKNPF